MSESLAEMAYGEPPILIMPAAPVGSLQALAKLTPVELAALMARLEEVGVLAPGRADEIANSEGALP